MHCEAHALHAAVPHHTRAADVACPSQHTPDPLHPDSSHLVAQVKLVKCVVSDVVVDVSFDTVGGLCTVAFLEAADRRIGRQHLFKRSILLVRGRAGQRRVWWAGCAGGLLPACAWPMSRRQRSRRAHPPLAACCPRPVHSSRRGATTSRACWARTTASSPPTPWRCAAARGVGLIMGTGSACCAPAVRAAASPSCPLHCQCLAVSHVNRFWCCTYSTFTTRSCTRHWM